MKRRLPLPIAIGITSTDLFAEQIPYPLPFFYWFFIKIKPELAFEFDPPAKNTGRLTRYAGSNCNGYRWRVSRRPQ
jgi:hypothetical protein